MLSPYTKFQSLSTSKKHVILFLVVIYNSMQKDIHPKYYPKCKVTCACGNTFEVGSTLPEIHVEICSHCHPFFTGKQKLVDSARRVEKFEAKMAKKESAAAGRKGRKVKHAAKKARKAKDVEIVNQKSVRVKKEKKAPKK